MSLYLVFLRRPESLDDRRSDPFWEFGSFGRTGCHNKNLLNPKTSPLTDGDQLVFLQGGLGEIRLVGLTPPVLVTKGEDSMEITWNSSYSPLTFESAPLLVSNDGVSDTPSVMDLLRGTNRNSYCAAAASRFRSRTKAIDAKFVKEIELAFNEEGRVLSYQYIDCIERNKESNWYRNAQRQRWAERKTREKLFSSLSKSGVHSVHLSIEPDQDHTPKCAFRKTKRRC